MEFIKPGSPIPLATSAFLVLIISSFLWKFLGINQNISGFLLSIIFSSFWMKEFKLNALNKIFYIFINTFMIFSTALGTNTVISPPRANYTDYSYSNAQASGEIERSFFDSWVNSK